MKNIWEKLKAFAVEVGYFLTSKIFLINFAKMLGIVAMLLFMLFWMMKCYSRHGSKTQVPKFTELNIKQATRQAEDLSFDIVITDSLYKEGFPADMVLEQNPLPYAAVKEGRTIYVKITKAAGDLIQLPDIAGRDDIRFYVQNLAMLGIKAGKIDTVLDANLTDGTIKQVLVRGQDVTTKLGDVPGIKVPQGSMVDFVISKRESNEADVPNFTGMTADEYSFLLESVGLKIGNVVGDPSVTNQNTAKVTRTEPAAGTKLKIGSTVNIFTTEGN